MLAGLSADLFFEQQVALHELVLAPTCLCLRMQIESEGGFSNSIKFEVARLD